MEMTSQAVALSKRPHVVIATPGRLQDHFDSSSEMAARFSRLRFLVLDEADRLLDVGFEKEMGGILKHLPQKRQTLLFSATMTENLRQLQVRRLCDLMIRLFDCWVRKEMVNLFEAPAAQQADAALFGDFD
jgi:superfamily II DNA/RNA helicase